VSYPLVWSRGLRRIARYELFNKLKVLRRELVSIMHEFDVLLPDTSLDGRRHSQKTQFSISCNQK